VFVGEEDREIGRSFLGGWDLNHVVAFSQHHSTDATEGPSA
jgi:hypothetical protein